VLFCLLFLSKAEGVKSSVLSALAGKNPLHVVTLTRIPLDKNGHPSAETGLYLPISASEAATVFTIVNYFLGDQKCSTKAEFEAKVGEAIKFDKNKFKEITNYLLQKKSRLKDQLTKELSSTFKPSLLQSAKNAIDKGEKIVPSPTFVEIDGIKLSLKSKCRLLTNDITNIKTGKITATRLLSLLSEDTDQSKIKEPIRGNVLYVLLNEEITYDQAKLLKDILEAFEKEEKSKISLILFNYLGLHGESPECFSLYTQAISALPQMLSNEPCIFVSNELFFGKNFILPAEYHTFMPPAPQNVLSCVNFLIDAVGEIALPTILLDGNESRFSSSSSELTYSKYKTYAQKAKKFFKNVSFYKVNTELVQEYVKGAYFEECDEAIKKEMYAYLFGSGRDTEREFSDLVSTQICYDIALGVDVRKDQKNLRAPIHIIQSNTKEISEYILPDNGQPNIPGKPKVIIHADPEKQEVFTAFPSQSLVLSSSSKPKITQRYSTVVPKENFTFIINKGNRSDSYTITHWVLNLQPNAEVSLPCSLASEGLSAAMEIHSTSTLTRDVTPIQKAIGLFDAGQYNDLVSLIYDDKLHIRPDFDEKFNAVPGAIAGVRSVLRKEKGYPETRLKEFLGQLIEAIRH
jgi:hypothetical protein